MEALAISAANLDTIEKNLGAVATELSGVINNVNSVNGEINKVENKVNELNDEIKSLVKEIRETTIINNARQNIMFNNDQINKKYGYFDIVRRRVESLIDAVENSAINKDSLVKLREDLLLNNPNYWLSNALSSLLSWILNDKENTYKELNNALKKNKQKTSLFFCLINLRFKRKSTSLNWLNNYLNNEDPTNLSSDFITVLDLVSNNSFGNEGKQIIINKISVWFKRLASDNQINSEEVNKWINYINKMEDDNINLPYLSILSDESVILKNNLEITSSYKNMLNKLKSITMKKTDSKKVDEVINNLIYEYESEEEIFKKDNLKNNLIIECNGDREKALEIFENEQNIYSEKVNLIQLLNNIVIYSERYKVCDETIKFSLSLIKNSILTAYEVINKNIIEPSIKINIDDFSVNYDDKMNTESKINSYLDNKIKSQTKNIITYFGIINIICILLMFITFSNRLICLIVLSFLLITDIYFIYKIVQEKNNIKIIKQNKKNDINIALEKGFAEITDYNNILNENKKYYEDIKLFLNNMDVTNYIKSNNERNIIVGE